MTNDVSLVVQYWVYVEEFVIKL